MTAESGPMPKGSVYQSGFQDLSARKFAIPRDLQGRPSSKILNVYKDADKMFSKVPGYVSITLHGSTAAGVREKKSDLDMGLIFDSTIPGFKNSELRETLKKVVAKHAAWWRKILGRGYNIDINMFFYTDLASLRRDTSSENEIADALIFLTEVSASTPRVQEYRALLAENLRARSVEFRKNAIRHALERITQFEQGNFIKMGTRMKDSLQVGGLIPAMTETGEMQSYVEARVKLWRDRMVKFYSLEPEDFDRHNS